MIFGAICTPGPPPEGELPPDLVRPLGIARPSPAGACPVPRLRPVPRNAGLGGPVYDLGVPVSVTAAAVIDPPETAAVADRHADGGWRGVKALWFTYPSYRGPLLIRGQRVDAPGVIAFGAGPQAGWLVIPPGPTINEENGYRQAPGALWVRMPGCYGFQVDGEGFSVTLTIRITTAGRRRSRSCPRGSPTTSRSARSPAAWRGGR